MGYSKQTYYYGIPYMGAGDILMEESEQQQLQIIDGLLYAATMGGSNCVIEDAVYTLSNTSSPNCTLTLTASGEHVVTALIAKRVAVVDTSVTFSLASNGYYYIYVRTTEGIDSDPASCEVVALTEETPSEGAILLATVNYTGYNAVLNTDTGKLYLTSIQSHILDDTNPHGETLNQTNLNVGGNPVHGSVIKELTTNGTAGAVVNIAELTPLFVTAMPLESGIGDVYFTLGTNSVTVYNTGSTGKSMKIKVEG